MTARTRSTSDTYLYRCERLDADPTDRTARRVCFVPAEHRDEARRKMRLAYPRESRFDCRLHGEALSSL